MKDELEVRRAATAMGARAIRRVSLEEIAECHPDPRDAWKIFEAMSTADAHMQWRDPYARAKVRLAAAVGSPIVIPVLAILWTVNALGALYRFIVRSPDRRAARAEAAYWGRVERGEETSPYANER